MAVNHIHCVRPRTVNDGKVMGKEWSALSGPRGNDVVLDWALTSEEKAHTGLHKSFVLTDLIIQFVAFINILVQFVILNYLLI